VLSDQSQSLALAVGTSGEMLGVETENSHGTDVHKNQDLFKTTRQGGAPIQWQYEDLGSARGSGVGVPLLPIFR